MSTFRWELADDLSFYAESGITNVGVALRKLETVGLDKGTAMVIDAGLRVTNLLGLGFDLSEPSAWAAHQRRLVAAVEAGARMGAECFVLTTGSARQLTWEQAAHELGVALAPVIDACRQHDVPFALEHTNSLRVDVGFVHTLRDVVDLASMLDIGVVMECNACWAERGLADTIARGAERFRLVQVSDFVIGTLATPDRAVPGDGHVPLERILRDVLVAGYQGVFDLELLGPRIEAEGYEGAVTRSVANLADLLGRASG